MSVRHDIRDGDTTTATGRVIATARNDMIDGKAAAYEGDPVWCPKCGTTGKIISKPSCFIPQNCVRKIQESTSYFQVSA